MPAWTTPLLRPVWCPASSASRSSTTAQPGPARQQLARRGQPEDAGADDDQVDFHEWADDSLSAVLRTNPSKQWERFGREIPTTASSRRKRCGDSMMPRRADGSSGPERSTSVLCSNVHARWSRPSYRAGCWITAAVWVASQSPSPSARSRLWGSTSRLDARRGRAQCPRPLLRQRRVPHRGSDGLPAGGLRPRPQRAGAAAHPGSAGRTGHRPARRAASTGRDRRPPPSDRRAPRVARLQRDHADPFVHTS